MKKSHLLTRICFDEVNPPMLFFTALLYSSNGWIVFIGGRSFPSKANLSNSLYIFMSSADPECCLAHNVRQNPARRTFLKINVAVPTVTGCLDIPPYVTTCESLAIYLQKKTIIFIPGKCIQKQRVKLEKKD